jgi:PKD repeat protein
MKEEQNIEELFRSHFDDFKVEPSEGLWGKISHKLSVKELFRFSFDSLNIWNIIVGGGLVLGILFVSFSQDDVHSHDEVIVTQEISSERNAEVTQEVMIYETDASHFDAVISEAEGLSPINYEIPQDEIANHGHDDSPDYRTDNEVVKVHEKAELIISYVDNEITQDLEDPKKDENKLLPVARFTASPANGCNNLRVQLRNSSENATEFRWLFGDGGSSTLKEPVYFYDKPGTYTLELEAISDQGTSDKVSSTIQVYQTPEAFFEIKTLEGSGYGRTVYFYNYSRGAESYIWNFGDGNSSIEKDPTHIYFDQGNFNVTLVTISINGCRDSMMLQKIFSDESYFIRFPNAFVPDKGGPSDGSYVPDDHVTKVFFPQYKGVVEYQLTIYDKTGRLIFETSTLERGWDGYFNNQLVPFGVYIWKARGRLENGKPFVKGGDVTVISN